MTLSCPHCGFAREIDPQRLPDRPIRVTCPRCSGTFSHAPVQAPATALHTAKCPQCGLEQQEAERCRECAMVLSEGTADHLHAGTGPVSTTTADVDMQPKAGFWVRVVAAVVDMFLASGLQFGLTFLLGLLIGAVARGEAEVKTMLALTQFFSTVVGITYYVFFTGYCGQTPGKMAVRVKVVRTDGEAVGYGRAFFREVIGKFVSAVILGIGYLMVAFDRQKQGLHDKMASTYVIKL